MYKNGIGQAGLIPPEVPTPTGQIPLGAPPAAVAAQSVVQGQAQPVPQAQAHHVPQAQAQPAPQVQGYQSSEFPLGLLTIQKSAVTGRPFVCVSVDGTSNGPTTMELDHPHMLNVIAAIKGPEWQDLLSLAEQLEQMGHKVTGKQLAPRLFVYLLYIFMYIRMPVWQCSVTSSWTTTGCTTAASCTSSFRSSTRTRGRSRSTR